MSKTISRNNILPFINIAKFISLCLVILSHSTDSSLMRWSSMFFIPIFFICAGYTTTGNINLRKKAKKLLVPYFILNFIFLLGFLIITKKVSWTSVIGIFYSRYSLFPLSFHHEENVFFLNIMNMTSWFLTAMFTTFVAYKFMMSLKNSVSILLIALIYLIITYFSTFLPILLPWSIDTCFLFAFFMFCGHLMRKFNLLKNIYSLLIGLIIYIPLLFLYIPVNESVRVMGGGNFLEYLAIVIGGITGSIILLYCCKMMEFIYVPIIHYLSRNSLIIFVVQIPFLVIIEKIGYLLEFNTTIIAFAQLIVALIGGCIVSEIYNFFFKKFKL